MGFTIKREATVVGTEWYELDIDANYINELQENICKWYQIELERDLTEQDIKDTINGDSNEFIDKEISYHPSYSNSDRVCKTELRELIQESINDDMWDSGFMDSETDETTGWEDTIVEND